MNNWNDLMILGHTELKADDIGIDSKLKDLASWFTFLSWYHSTAVATISPARKQNVYEVKKYVDIHA